MNDVLFPECYMEIFSTMVLLKLCIYPFLPSFFLSKLFNPQIHTHTHTHTLLAKRRIYSRNKINGGSAEGN